MSAATVRQSPSDFDPRNAPIAPIEFRSGQKIPFAGLARVWLGAEVETRPAAEPLVGREGKAQGAVLLLFALVAAFMAGGAGAAAWNMRGAIAEPPSVISTHEVLTRKAIRLYDGTDPAAVPAGIAADRDRLTKDQIQSVGAFGRDAEESVPPRRAAHAEAATRVGILLTASCAVAQILLVALFYRLIARGQELARRLENLAMTDSLTGLANRRALEIALESAVSRAKRYNSDLSVIFLDVDHFKQFNDRFGHKVGDEVLRAVARVVQSSVRAQDVAGRYGGEEFLVVVPETDEAGSVELAERIRTAVRALDLPLPPVTISLGVATLGTQSSSAAALVAKADQALYVSKQGGRDRVTHFHSPLRIRGECVAHCPEDWYLVFKPGCSTKGRGQDDTRIPGSLASESPCHVRLSLAKGAFFG